MQIRKAILDVFNSHFEGNDPKVDAMVRADDGSEVFKKHKIVEEGEKLDFIDFSPDGTSAKSTATEKSKEETCCKYALRHKEHRKKRKEKEAKKDVSQKNVQRDAQEASPKDKRKMVYSVKIGKPGSLQDFVTSRKLSNSVSGIFANSKLSKPVQRRKNPLIAVTHRRESETMKMAIKESLDRIVHGSPTGPKEDENRSCFATESASTSVTSDTAKSNNRPSLDAKSLSLQSKTTPFKTPCTSLPFETPLAEISQYLKTTFNPKELFDGKDYLKELQERLRKIYKQKMSLFADEVGEDTPCTSPWTEGQIRLQSRKSLLPKVSTTERIIRTRSPCLSTSNDKQDLREIVEDSSSLPFNHERQGVDESHFISRKLIESTDSVMEPREADRKGSDQFCSEKVSKGQYILDEYSTRQQPVRNALQVTHDTCTKRRKIDGLENESNIYKNTFYQSSSSSTQREAPQLQTYRTNVLDMQAPRSEHENWTDISNSTVSSLLHLRDASAIDFLDYIDKFQSGYFSQVQTADTDPSEKSPLRLTSKPPVDSPTPPREMYRMRMF